jgi:hypothetical protein
VLTQRVLANKVVIVIADIIISACVKDSAVLVVSAASKKLYLLRNIRDIAIASSKAGKINSSALTRSSIILLQ